MLWIENTVKSTPSPPFSTNSKVDMADCVNHHNMVVRSAFSALSSA
jgi:hypothetical protein